MSDIALLAHQEPVFGAAPSDTTVRRTLELADPRTLDKIARVRARVRGTLVADRGDPGRVPVADHRREAAGGWLVIDLDATLITAHRQGGRGTHLQVATASIHWRRGGEYGRGLAMLLGRATPARTPSPITPRC